MTISVATNANLPQIVTYIESTNLSEMTGRTAYPVPIIAYAINGSVLNQPVVIGAPAPDMTRLARGDRIILLLNQLGTFLADSILSYTSPTAVNINLGLTTGSWITNVPALAISSGDLTHGIVLSLTIQQDTNLVTPQFTASIY